jgi:CheY-like chemotaxis protein
VLSVEDTGEGMSRETIARACEPFFTTKAASRGSGLGLSMVDGFANQSGGRLEIDSEPGRGTIVKLYLPQTCDAAPATRQVETEPASGRMAHILVAEDDELVRHQVQRQLSALGYRVTVTSHGAEALEQLAQHSDVDLLFTDVVMPGGMNGRQLADHARLLKPDLPVLFTTGYTEDAILRAGALDAEILPKPYRRVELGRKVAQALGHV